MAENDSAATIDPRSSVEIEDVAASIPKGSPKVSAKIYFDAAVAGARAQAIADVVDTYESLTFQTRLASEKSA